GFFANVLFAKFEAVIYGKLTIEANLTAEFERKNPDTVVPEWLDNWIGVVGKAEIGIDIVLIHENVMRANGAIKTGFEVKFRISPGLLDRFGVEYMIYFLGVSASVSFKVICFKEKKKEVQFIEGNPKELPWRRGAFPRPAANSFWNVKKIINLAWSRAKYHRSRIESCLNKYSDLQWDMVLASKTQGDTYPYQGTQRPDIANDVYTDSWAEQWRKCSEAFIWERQTVWTRTGFWRIDLSKRLYQTVEMLDIRVRKFKPRLAAIKKIMEEIQEINEELAEMEEFADETDTGVEAEFKNRVKRLSRRREINCHERIGKRPITITQALLKDLQHYAAKRIRW
ncbi:MAG: hypothetical protein V3S16_03160, partial [Candidatus Desulfatibia sp.]|uniref:hypothetical protein n=1 Tax=Candidatus Desulfatibia sp. TaxID=3101189 RepID=UPI002F2E435A